MARPTYMVMDDGPGYGWYVRVWNGVQYVHHSGPFLNREGANAEATRLFKAERLGREASAAILEAATLDAQPQPVDAEAHARLRDTVEALESQVRLNDAVARALESLALQADRYDSELRELRAELLELREQVADAHTRIGQLNRLHSVKS